MHEDIRMLKELQDVDYWIGELERSREFLPEMMRNLEAEIEQVAVDLKAKKERLIAAQLEIKDVGLSIGEHKEHVSKYQEQMLTIKTNKEYDALVVQIDASKAQIAVDEEKSLALMAEIDELEKSVGELEEKTGTIRELNNEKLKELQIQMDSVQGKVDEKEAHREHLKPKSRKMSWRFTSACAKAAAAMLLSACAGAPAANVTNPSRRKKCNWSNAAIRCKPALLADAS